MSNIIMNDYCWTIIANVLANHQITVYLPDTYKTTPELSFAVRNLNMPAVVLRLRTANDNSGVVLYVSGK
jgi:phosphoglucomutase